jgi:hypothetical protein
MKGIVFSICLNAGCAVWRRATWRASHHIRAIHKCTPSCVAAAKPMANCYGSHRLRFQFVISYGNLTDVRTIGSAE